MPINNFASVLASGVKGAFKSTPVGGGLAGLASGFAATTFGSGLSAGGAEEKPKRHRRKHLTQGQISDILLLKETLGAKAAEVYLLRQNF